MDELLELALIACCRYGRALDYDRAREVLADEYASAEAAFGNGLQIDVPDGISESTVRLFASSTQAYRESLIGCALARILDPQIDIRLPYMNQGDDAFSGRTLDQTVVNPFLRDQAIPCSTGPYLSSIRRNVSFVPETRGQRDRRAYTRLLEFIRELSESDADTARLYLRHLLLAFIRLREAANIPLADVYRLSLEQYDALMIALRVFPLALGDGLADPETRFPNPPRRCRERESSRERPVLRN